MYVSEHNVCNIYTVSVNRNTSTQKNTLTYILFLLKNTLQDNIPYCIYLNAPFSQFHLLT